MHVDEIDVLVESDAAPFALADPPPTDVDRAIAEHAARSSPTARRCRPGSAPSRRRSSALLAEGDGGDYGIHSEMFTTGLMRLHEAGKVTNRKGQFDGVSVATFAAGTEELYEWLDGNHDVAFLPVEVVNSPERDRPQPRRWSRSTARSRSTSRARSSPTRSRAPSSRASAGTRTSSPAPRCRSSDRSLLCLPSTVTVGRRARRSRIVPWFEAGEVITTPRHQVDVIVTEYGAAELQGKTVHQRGEALAAIAHPDFRDELLEAAERASGGRAPITSCALGVVELAVGGLRRSCGLPRRVIRISSPAAARSM